MNHSNLDPIAAILLDVEKVFDRVEWGFLLVALEKYGFGLLVCFLACYQDT